MDWEQAGAPAGRQQYARQRYAPTAWQRYHPYANQHPVRENLRLKWMPETTETSDEEEQELDQALTGECKHMMPFWALAEYCRVEYDRMQREAPVSRILGLSEEPNGASGGPAAR